MGNETFYGDGLTTNCTSFVQEDFTFLLSVNLSDSLSELLSIACKIKNTQKGKKFMLSKGIGLGEKIYFRRKSNCDPSREKGA